MSPSARAREGGDGRFTYELPGQAISSGFLPLMCLVRHVLADELRDSSNLTGKPDGIKGFEPVSFESLPLMPTDIPGFDRGA